MVGVGGCTGMGLRCCVAGLNLISIRRNIKMKNLMSLLVAGLILGLVGCGEAEPTVAPTEDTKVDEHAGHEHGDGEHSHDEEGKDGAKINVGETIQVAALCPISGKKLGSMGDPVVKTIGGKEVKFCCANCVAPYEKKIAAAAKKAE